MKVLHKNPVAVMNVWAKDHEENRLVYIGRDAGDGQFPILVGVLRTGEVVVPNEERLGT